MENLWNLTESSFDPAKQHHKETIFTIGNGYLATRGAFEEGYPGDRRATFVHGVFDAAPLVFTEIANAPDWLPLTVTLNGERFSMNTGAVEAYERTLDMHSGLLTRTVGWVSPSGLRARFIFERFTSLADPHLLYLRCSVTPEFEGVIEFRGGLNGNSTNDGLAHWEWLGQGAADGGQAIYLHNRTRATKIELAYAMRLQEQTGQRLGAELWDVEDAPTQVLRLAAKAGQALVVDKCVAVFTSRDTKEVVAAALQALKAAPDWATALSASMNAWARDWEAANIIIEGDAEAQLAVRFGLFQLYVAAPRHDDRVNIGAKTLSGFGYRGHAFWDTEIFMLPVFIYTAPQIAKNLLNYRYINLPGAEKKARLNGFEGAQFPWESANTGEEVTPTWLPFGNSDKLVRIWTGDIEIHISADIAYAAQQYWQATGDDNWMAEKGAELVLDTAKFWASRAEWKAVEKRYEYRDVIGPDEYHDHVDNNLYTNRLARFNLESGFRMLDWLQQNAPKKAQELTSKLDLTPERLAHWRDVIQKIYLPGEGGATPLYEQFEGYFQRKDVDLKAQEPRTRSMQEILGIEGANQTQVLKQPDVLMLLYLMRQYYSDEAVQVNYDYYTPRTDLTYGSSLGPSIQAIAACEVGKPEDAYENFIRAARADLRDVRGNAGDGIHGASAGGAWQAVVFGFGGLHVSRRGYAIKPRLPKLWKRLMYRFYLCGKLHEVDLRRENPTWIKGFIFDLDGVLTDTAEFHFRAWQRLADEIGIPFTRQDNEALRGVSRRQSLALLLKGRPVTEDEAQEMMERKNNYYRELLKDMTPDDVLPGAREILAELRVAGIKIALASASKNARDVVNSLKLQDDIDILCDGYSVDKAKPAPDLFLFAGRQLGLQPDECVVVEDAEAGVEAAIAAGMYSIGLGPVERVGKADLVLPSLENQNLHRILEALKAKRRPA